MFGFLFDTRTITVTLPKQDYEDFMYLVNAAKAKDPNFNEETVFINLVREFNKKYLGNAVQKMVTMGKKQTTSGRKSRVSLP